MYGYYNEFHESYYNHNCLIIPEKDVLDTDIVGTGFVTRLQRWWNDLFLLSCTGARSRGFYLSSHAISIERLRQFRKYRSRIHPMSKFRYLLRHILLYRWRRVLLYSLCTSFAETPLMPYSHVMCLLPHGPVILS